MANDTEMRQFISEKVIQLSELDFMDELGDFYCKYMIYTDKIRSLLLAMDIKTATEADRKKLTPKELEFVKNVNWWRDAIVNMKEEYLDKMIQEYVKIQFEMKYWAKSAKAAESEKEEEE